MQSAPMGAKATGHPDTVIEPRCWLREEGFRPLCPLCGEPPPGHTKAAGGARGGSHCGRELTRFLTRTGPGSQLDWTTGPFSPHCIYSEVVGKARNGVVIGRRAGGQRSVLLSDPHPPPPRVSSSSKGGSGQHAVCTPSVPRAWHPATLMPDNTPGGYAFVWSLPLEPGTTL